MCVLIKQTHIEHCNILHCRNKASQNLSWTPNPQHLNNLLLKKKWHWHGTSDKNHSATFLSGIRSARKNHRGRKLGKKFHIKLWSSSDQAMLVTGAISNQMALSDTFWLLVAIEMFACPFIPLKCDYDGNFFPHQTGFELRQFCRPGQFRRNGKLIKLAFSESVCSRERLL